MASPSDCPVCLARQLPSFLTCLSAVVCHPPIDSTTKGRKENTLALAVLCCTSHLPIMGKLKGMSRFQSCLSHCCCLEGVDDARSQNCGITAFEMLGRFGLGGQVWPDMHNSNQKSSNCNKEVAPKTCHFKQTICRLQKNLILTADVWFCSGCDIGQRSEVALSMKKSLCMLKIYEWIITRI